LTDTGNVRPASTPRTGTLALTCLLSVGERAVAGAGGASLPYPPGLLLLACQQPASQGGDTLLADSPKLHFRRPDVVVYRCIDDDRGRWGRKPIAADCLIAVEIVSADSITTDIRDKRAEYAAAGIAHCRIVRMTDNDGPAISVERLLLTSDGEYTREGLAIRGRDFHAIDTISPFPLKLTWEALDEGL
jgi:Putative restriction endonuclease